MGMEKMANEQPLDEMQRQKIIILLNETGGENSRARRSHDALKRLAVRENEKPLQL